MLFWCFLDVQAHSDLLIKDVKVTPFQVQPPPRTDCVQYYWWIPQQPPAESHATVDASVLSTEEGQQHQDQATVDASVLSTEKGQQHQDHATVDASVLSTEEGQQHQDQADSDLTSGPIAWGSGRLWFNLRVGAEALGIRDQGEGGEGGG